jgi:hypothetical protein
MVVVGVVVEEEEETRVDEVLRGGPEEVVGVLT